jgi:hypothetical protein
MENINDTIIEYDLKLPENTYHQFCKNIYSQNGEDGILEQIFAELSIEKGLFCEFGATDGIFSSNTLNLFLKGWSGMLIEGDENKYKSLVNNFEKFKNVILVNKYIDNEYDTENSLNTILKKYNFPDDFDLLSIDIDCNDYYVWKNLLDFEPKVVIIEVNSYRDPLCIEYPKHKAYQETFDILEEWKPDRIKVGTSYLAMVKLGLDKNYIPISFTGNIIFVHKKYIDKLIKFPYIISTDPYNYLYLYTNLSLWENKWYTNTGLILNTAIRNYYKTFKNTNIDLEWVLNHMKEHDKNVWDY